MSIKSTIKAPLRRAKNYIRWRRKATGAHRFEDRRRGEKTLLIILAGYKPYLYADVFARVRSFAPPEWTSASYRRASMMSA